MQKRYHLAQRSNRKTEIMKNYFTLFSLCGLMSFYACSEEELSPTASILEFANLEVGNYWIYDWYEITPDGQESSYATRDSIFIEGDTLISGRRYLIRTGTHRGHLRRELLFDSAMSIYRYPFRDILFTLDDEVEVTKSFGHGDNIIAVGTYSLESATTSVTVPAGQFECFSYTGTIESVLPDYQHGTRYNSYLYSNEVGLVLMRTHFFSSPNNLEMRLVDYGASN